MKAYLFLFLFFGSIFCASGQSYSGNVLDAFDKKYLEGVTVSVAGKGQTTTNARGYFSLEAEAGDTLRLSFPGFIDHQQVLDEESFLLLQIQDEARLLPTFQVEAEPYRFRFKDGKLYLAEEEPEAERRLSSSVSAGALNSPNLTPGFAMYGVLSSLTKRNRELRKYEEKLRWIERRKGYLEVIDSEPLRKELMDSYEMDREDWDAMILRFNEFHLNHEFLDWPKDRVEASLKEFVKIDSGFAY